MKEEQNSYMNNVGTPHQKTKPQAEKKNWDRKSGE